MRVLDRVNLAYIIIFFSTTASLLLGSRPHPQQLGHYHWVAYWMINGILFFNAWLCINALENRPAWLRKLVATIVLPAALLLANLLFPILLEGGKPAATIVTILFLALGFVAASTGFVVTRGNPLAQPTEADVAQAKRILKGCISLLFGVGTLIGSLAANESIRNAYVRIYNDTYLLVAAAFIVGELICTFLILPFVIANSIQIPTNSDNKK